MSEERQKIGYWHVLGFMAAIALLAVAVSTGIAGAEHRDWEYSDADTHTTWGSTYHIGQDLFLAGVNQGGLSSCPDRFVLTTVQGTASLADGVEMQYYQRKVHPDAECEAVFDTSGLEPGLYQVYNEYDTPVGTVGAPKGNSLLGTRPIRLITPRVVDAPDDGGDGDGSDGSGDGGDGSGGAGSGTESGGSDDADGDVDDDVINVITPDIPKYEDPDFTDPDLNWSAVAPAAIIVDGSVGEPGNTTEVRIKVTNTASETEGYIVELLQMPSELTIVDRDDAGGTWNDDRWLFTSIEAGRTVRPNLTVRLPSNPSASGVANYTVEGGVKTRNRIVATDTGLVSAIDNASLCQAIAGSDGVISDSEVLRAVNAWNDDEPLPSVGRRVTDEQILAIIEAWREGKDCGGFTLPEPPGIPNQDIPQGGGATGAVPGV